MMFGTDQGKNQPNASMKYLHKMSCTILDVVFLQLAKLKPNQSLSHLKSAENVNIGSMLGLVSKQNGKSELKPEVTSTSDVLRKYAPQNDKLLAENHVDSKIPGYSISYRSHSVANDRSEVGV